MYIKKTKKIIIESNQSIRRACQKELQARDCKVIELADGKDATKTIIREKPDLVLLDILISGKDGFEVIKEVRQAESKEIEKTSIFVMSNLVNQEDIKEAKNLGVIEYIIKDKSNPIEIAKKVNAYLSK